MLIIPGLGLFNGDRIKFDRGSLVLKFKRVLEELSAESGCDLPEEPGLVESWEEETVFGLSNSMNSASSKGTSRFMVM
jgi:hypothetical protein